MKFPVPASAVMGRAERRPRTTNKLILKIIFMRGPLATVLIPDA